MPDAVTKRGGLDRKRINMSEEREARYVSKERACRSGEQGGQFR